MWGAAGSPSTQTPPGSPPAACQDKATPCLQQGRRVIQGWPFYWLWWQIRPLERGGGQGCPSAPVFVHQLGLISSVLTVVHWFPLHVPRGFQTPSQSSSAPSPESSCLWTQAIFFSLFLSFSSPPASTPRLVQTVLTCGQGFSLQSTWSSSVPRAGVTDTWTTRVMGLVPHSSLNSSVLPARRICTLWAGQTPLFESRAAGPRG